jgi:hypothetical protein
MRNVNLRRYLHSSLLRRTGVYVSLLGISGALHLDVFDQPARWVLLRGSSLQFYAVALSFPRRREPRDLFLLGTLAYDGVAGVFYASQPPLF